MEMISASHGLWWSRSLLRPWCGSSVEPHLVGKYRAWGLLLYVFVSFFPQFQKIIKKKTWLNFVLSVFFSCNARGEALLHQEAKTPCWDGGDRSGQVLHVWVEISTLISDTGWKVTPSCCTKIFHWELSCKYEEV